MTSTGNTPIYLSIKEKHIEAASELIEVGCRVVSGHRLVIGQWLVDVFNGNYLVVIFNYYKSWLVFS